MARYGQAFKDKASARFAAVLTTASMDEAGKSAWCRGHGLYPQELVAWRQSALQAQAQPEEVRASPQQTRQDRRRIQELERELRRKDNALAETINGLYKAEVIHRQSWKNREAVELATLDWVDWFNHRRLLGPIGHIPPAEAEANYHRQQDELAMAA